MSAGKEKTSDTKKEGKYTTKAIKPYKIPESNSVKTETQHTPTVLERKFASHNHARAGLMAVAYQSDPFVVSLSSRDQTDCNLVKRRGQTGGCAEITFSRHRE